ncbi:hypothetical protein H6G89_26080 [Oscillatoria sp. FACHB-1407]|uniref:hypothetical protein n=1 Tax=Oscillatoria sp. FACHB-1407 TaxID=2692847 RepID=UPI0016868377|nr:hypothetical protein [Oscillatoria sp. FACHB-1407]MBD2464479.1 hypothetical protein [Oscillatoria sp. FACHB-1407]
MPRPKRGSVVLNKAIRRAAGMRSISETLQFGDGLSLIEYDDRIQTLQMQLSSYNTMLSKLDEMAGHIGLLEQDLGSYSEKMLMSVATRYGKDSLQYMQAGGKVRKRSTRSASTPAIASGVATSAATNGNGTQAAVS